MCGPLRTEWSDIAQESRLFPKPVIGALNGHTIAGGCMIALACDRLLMVSGRAKVSLNEVGFGSSVFAGVFLNEGDGLFDEREILVEAENRIFSLVVADLDGDPFPDLVTADYERSTLSVSLGKKPE